MVLFWEFYSANTTNKYQEPQSKLDYTLQQRLHQSRCISPQNIHILPKLFLFKIKNYLNLFIRTGNKHCLKKRFQVNIRHLNKKEIIRFCWYIISGLINTSAQVVATRDQQNFRSSSPVRTIKREVVNTVGLY